MTDILTANIRRIRARIAAACARVGRDVQDVTMVAVTKYADIESVRELVSLGVTEFGESRPQQLVSRSEQLPVSVHWHLIGHLQRNKIDMVLPAVSQIHSVDSVRLLESLNSSARKLGVRPRLLLEVNVSGETSKDGFAPSDLLAAWLTISELESVEVGGLMTMAPHSEDLTDVRRVFRELRELRDRLAMESGGTRSLPDLSMGMSGDFEIAIEEGATIVRIGSSLFEGIPER
ncbi:MAG: YggS family pyridoxal phosphate-dependent enzyme [Planctomycetota bacterium]